MKEIRAAVKYPPYASLVVLADGKQQVSGDGPQRTWVGQTGLLLRPRASPVRNTLISGSRPCRAWPIFGWTRHTGLPMASRVSPGASRLRADVLPR